MTTNEAINQFSEEYKKLKDSERNIFSKISLKLLNETFILRDKEGEKNDYLSAKNLIPVLRPYFEFINFSLNHDFENGIIYIKTELDSNRVRFNKLETISALVIRSISFSETQKVSISSKIITTVSAIASEIAKTEIYNNFDGGSVEFRNALKSLRKRKLIDFDGDLGLGNTPIVVYRTINLVINTSSLQDLNEQIKKFKGAESDEENKEIKIN